VLGDVAVDEAHRMSAADESHKSLRYKLGELLRDTSAHLLLLTARPIRDPARLDWNEVTKVAHYYLRVNAMTKPMQVREDSPPYGGSS
jgi:hypothetical protein